MVRYLIMNNGKYLLPGTPKTKREYRGKRKGKGSKLCKFVLNQINQSEPNTQKFWFHGRIFMKAWVFYLLQWGLEEAKSRHLSFPLVHTCKAYWPAILLLYYTVYLYL